MSLTSELGWCVIRGPVMMIVVATLDTLLCVCDEFPPRSLRLTYTNSFLCIYLISNAKIVPSPSLTHTHTHLCVHSPLCAQYEETGRI